MHHNPGLTLASILTLTLSLYLTHVKVRTKKQIEKINKYICLVLEGGNFLNGTLEFRLPANRSLSDAVGRWVLLTSRGQSDKRYGRGT